MDAVTTAAPNNSLRQRMLQDMKMRGLGVRIPRDRAQYSELKSRGIPI